MLSSMLRWARNLAWASLILVLTLPKPAAAQSYVAALADWIPTGAPQGGSGPILVTLNDGTALLMTTVTDSGGSRTIAERYHPESGTWVLTGSPLQVRFGFTATVLADGRVLVVGGRSSSAPLGSAEIYDPDVGTWRLAGALHFPRSRHAATVLRSGEVLVSGGQAASGAGEPALETEIYNPTTDTWRPTGSMRVPRLNHVAAPLPDGRVLVAGGVSVSDVVPRLLDAAEIYDPVSGQWTAAAPMTRQRGTIQGVTLPDGRVLVLGANGFDQRLSSELFDPAIAAWVPGGDPAFAQNYSRVVGLGLLPGNQVLALVQRIPFTSDCGLPILQGDERCIVASAAGVFHVAAATWTSAVTGFDTHVAGRNFTVLNDGRGLAVVGASAQLFEVTPPAELVAFVRGLYEDVLGRAPDQPGLDAWTDFLWSNCGIDRAAVTVTSFIGSHEFRTERVLPPADIPGVLYRAVLGRGPEPTAVEGIVGYFQAVRTAFAVDSFLHSVEGENVRSGVPGVALAEGNYIRQVYQQLLGRDPEPGVTTSWMAFLEATGDLDFFVRTVVTSREHEARPSTLEGFITSLYRALLFRDPFPQERDAWTAAYNRTVLDLVTSSLLPSKEFVDRVATVCRQ